MSFFQLANGGSTHQKKITRKKMTKNHAHCCVVVSISSVDCSSVHDAVQNLCVFPLWGTKHKRARRCVRSPPTHTLIFSWDPSAHSGDDFSRFLSAIFPSSSRFFWRLPSCRKAKPLLILPMVRTPGCLGGRVERGQLFCLFSDAERSQAPRRPRNRKTALPRHYKVASPRTQKPRRRRRRRVYKRLFFFSPIPRHFPVR